jgi:hypothetical protein
MRKKKTIFQPVIFKIAGSRFPPFFILFVVFISLSAFSQLDSTCHFRESKLPELWQEMYTASRRKADYVPILDLV